MYLARFMRYSIIYLASNFYIKLVGVCVYVCVCVCGWVGGWVGSCGGWCARGDVVGRQLTVELEHLN